MRAQTSQPVCREHYNNPPVAVPRMHYDNPPPPPHQHHHPSPPPPPPPPSTKNNQKKGGGGGISYHISNKFTNQSKFKGCTLRNQLSKMLRARPPPPPPFPLLPTLSLYPPGPLVPLPPYPLLPLLSIHGGITACLS